MTNTIASILEAGDIEALHRYAQTPSAKTLDDARVCGHGRTPRPPNSVRLWRALWTIFTGVQTLSTLCGLAPCVSCIATTSPSSTSMCCTPLSCMPISTPPALRATTRGVFSTVRQMNHTGTALCLDKDGLVDHFGDLYALLAAVLPRAEAKEHLLQQARRLDLTLDDVATFLITYGAEAFHDTADLVRAGQQRANFDHLCNAEERFVAMMLTASAHQHLAFVSALDLAAFRNRSACSILGHLTDAAHAPA